MNSKVILNAYELLSMFIVFPAPVQSQDLLVPLNDETKKIFEQLLDIELLQQNIVQCYQLEKGTLATASLARQSWGETAELDGKLFNRVFARLEGTPEYEKFVDAHWAVVQRPDYRSLYLSELFAEYMRLFESAKTRLTRQLKERGRAADPAWGLEERIR